MAAAVWALLACLALLWPSGAGYIQKTTEVHATKGRFMVHMLHSAYLFGQSVNVKWKATVKGKPELPVWLHLAPSRHQVIAYLAGTPVTPLQQVTIHVIARRLDNYQTADQYITILLSEDLRFNSTTQQLVEIRVKNVEAEDFYNDNTKNKVKLLENVIQRTFPGKGVNPYVFSIMPEFLPVFDDDNFYRHKHVKSGSIIQVGTQSRFHPNVQQLANYRDNPEYCAKNNIIPLDRHFRGAFDVDWCQFYVKNVTLLRGFVVPTTANPTLPEDIDEEQMRDLRLQNERIQAKRLENAQNRAEVSHPYHFWESVVIFPLLAVLCILLILFLSLIFFGRREGQQWRDYKTPKEQLHEYLNVRESQRHLRELSVQRQMLLMNQDRSKSATPLGVQAFLQPRGASMTPSLATKRPQPGESSTLPPPYSPVSLTLPRRDASHKFDSDEEKRPPLNTRSSVGKQTVAEAALATGSSLNLYRNPLDYDETTDLH